MTNFNQNQKAAPQGQQTQQNRDTQNKAGGMKGEPVDSASRSSENSARLNERDSERAQASQQGAKQGSKESLNQGSRKAS